MASVAKTFMNDALAESMSKVVDAGWANQSDGDLNGVFGRFALILITVNEVSELYSAVFDDDHTPEATLQPGNFLFAQTPEAKLVIEFPTPEDAEAAFVIMQREYENAWKRAAINADIAAMGAFFERGDDDEDWS